MLCGSLLLVLSLSADTVFTCALYNEELDLRSAEDLLRYRRDITSNCGPDDPSPPNRVNTTLPLAMLRAEMSNINIGAYVVPYDAEGRRSWISGFSGSSGDAIITMDKAAAWTDGRYFLQASDQLDCNWELMKMGQPGVPTYIEWLKGDANLPQGTKIGADPRLIGAQNWLQMASSLQESNLDLVSISSNLIDNIWTTENGRPEFQPRDVVVHSAIYAGRSLEFKISSLRTELSSKGFGAMVVSEVDEIAWLFNLRGEGTSQNTAMMHSPFFQALALVSDNEVYLWMHKDKLTPSIEYHLNSPTCETTNTCVIVGEYQNALTELTNWALNNLQVNSVLVTNPSTYLSGASYAVYEALPAESVKFADSPVLFFKALKNEVEVQGMIDASIRDAYALIEFYAFMEDQIVNKKVDTWDEISAAEKLQGLREAQPRNRGLSFTTISASGSNAAIIHYTPSEETVAKINDSAIYLVDSGGQYLEATTDVTRTFHYGTPDPEIVEMYTRVLMGAIDLASTIVPKDTLDRAVDLATRNHIFKKGLDYRHGTGHGIGAYLNVHEGPIRIAMSGDAHPLKEGYFFSDEPGYYKDGEYGIRLETIIRVVKKDFPDDTYGSFIGFEPVTLVPFEPNLIDFSLMTPAQIEWYNDYNSQINEKVRPYFSDAGRDDVLEWLDSKTSFVNPSTSNVVQQYITNNEI